MNPPLFDVVVPTVGRASLPRLLNALAAGTGPAPTRILLVDDRARPQRPLLAEGLPASIASLVTVLAGQGRGPAAARNIGWRAASSPWVAFLDDDVVPAPDWAARLVEDLAACDTDVAGTQGKVNVPLPADRRPTDWERNVVGLERARWATADLAYRRDALAAVGGFDERFPRAYREDADLGLRVTAAGWRIVEGQRRVSHPVRPAPWHVSVGMQAGNADDALMDRLHGGGWRVRAGAPPGTRTRHLLTTAFGALALAALLAHRPRLAAVAGLGWSTASADLAWRRIAPGPRTPAEVGAMVATSAVLSGAATAAWLAGLVRARRLAPTPTRGPVEAVLLDRDGTLVVDVPYNGDPRQVRPVPGARAALERLRAAGLPLAVVSNQSGIARGLLTRAQVDAVHERVEELLGPFAATLDCPHGPLDGCECRKPRPGLVHKAAAELGVDPASCALIGDIGADMAAALAAGARAILVPTAVTRPEEVAAAPAVALDLAAAVDLLLHTRRLGRRGSGAVR